MTLTTQGCAARVQAEAAASRTAAHQIRDALAALKRAEDEAAASAAAVVSLQQERAALQNALAAAGTEGEALRTQLGRVEALMDEVRRYAGRAHVGHKNPILCVRPTQLAQHPVVAAASR